MNLKGNPVSYPFHTCPLWCPTFLEPPSIFQDRMSFWYTQTCWRGSFRTWWRWCCVSLILSHYPALASFNILKAPTSFVGLAVRRTEWLVLSEEQIMKWIIFNISHTAVRILTMRLLHQACLFTCKDYWWDVYKPRSNLSDKRKVIKSINLCTRSD